MIASNLHQAGIGAVCIGDIIIGERHRKDLGDLQGLADSIAAEGLLQPIGITSDRTLVFGERRLRACRDILGWTEIDARVVNVSSIVAGEFAENEMRKEFTASERVAIAVAVRQILSKRHGSNQHSRSVEDVDRGPTPLGRSRDIAAQRAGFDSGKQLDRASNVVRLGTPRLVEAMDAGRVSITAASEIAKAAPADQAAIVGMDEPERIEAMRRRREEATRLRAMVAEQETRTGPTAFTTFVSKNGRLPSDDEAKTIARLDFRETPAEGGKRHKPVDPPSKSERLRKKEIDAMTDEIWRAQQAVQLLGMNKTDPALLMAHVHYLDRKIFDEQMRRGRAWFNRFAREYRKHGK